MDIQKLKSQIDGEVDDSAGTLDNYRHDASIFDIRPEVVVYPKTAEDLKQVVKFAAEKKASLPNISVTARSAGTDMGGGAVNESIVVDFTRYFKNVLEFGEYGKQQTPTSPSAVADTSPYKAEDIAHPFPHLTMEGKTGYVVVEPGVYYRDLEKMTLQHDLIMPTYPASKSLCAMGGIMANNSGGEKSLTYGKSINFIDEISAVLSDGNEYQFGALSEPELEAKMKLATFEGKLYRDIFHLIKENYDDIQAARPHVTKNSAGYYLWDVWNKETKIFNMAKLLVGSQGTLGLFTKGRFKLVEPHPKSKLLVMFLNDLAPLGSLVNTVMSFHPETFESYDDHTLSLAMKFLPSMLKKMKGNIITLGFQFLPEAWMVLTGGMPKLVLIAEFAGTSDDEIMTRAQQAQKAVIDGFHLKTHITKDAAEAEKYWTVRRESFNLLRQHVKNRHTAPFIDDFIVHPADLPMFLPKLDAIFKEYPSLIYTIAGHAGDANFHIIPLMDFTKESERAIIPKLSHQVYDLVLQYKGSITAEHNDGLVRGPYLEKMYGPKIFDLFKQVKHIFDPQNIFNPHKKTDATEEYLVSHIRKD